MNEMIEKLKDKNYVRAFGLMKPEEQEYLKKVGKKNCDFYSDGGRWNAGPGVFFPDFNLGVTYAIKPDYQPEPEPVDLEIVLLANGWLGVARYSACPIVFAQHESNLHCLPSLPNFMGFYLTSKDTEVDLENVARYMPNVVARFRA